MSHLIKIFLVCKFSYFYLVLKELMIIPGNDTIYVHSPYTLQAYSVTPHFNHLKKALKDRATTYILWTFKKNCNRLTIKCVVKIAEIGYVTLW